MKEKENQSDKDNPFYLVLINEEFNSLYMYLHYLLFIYYLLLYRYVPLFTIYSGYWLSQHVHALLKSNDGAIQPKIICDFKCGHADK